MQDCRGNALSTSSTAAVAALDSATAQLNAFHGDPVGTLVEALKAQPDFVMGQRLPRGGVRDGGGPDL